MPSTEDVVVYVIVDDKLVSYGRGTQAEAEQFIASPKWPADPHAIYIAVDDWGSGTIVAASPKCRAWVGWSKRQFQLTVTREPQRARA